ncbi:MAG: pentapeptide repeat-containing protein [Polyangiaceae bacterium]
MVSAPLFRLDLPLTSSAPPREPRMVEAERAADTAIDRLRQQLAEVEAGKRDRIELPKALLRGADLSGLDLTGADLSGANLAEANLTRTVLFGADLSGAALVDATLDEVELSGANLRGAFLHGARGRQAGLGGASLVGADLGDARLPGVSLVDADLEGADLRCASFEEGRLNGAKLSGADATSACLRGADLSGVAMGGGTFDRCDFRGALILEVIDYEHARFIGADIRDVPPLGAQLWKRFVADQNYLAEFRARGRGAEIWYQLWWLTSDCGRSLSRWAAATTIQLLLFGLAYTQLAVDYGAHATALSPYYFSVVTMTTLGYGDVQPASMGAQLVAMLQVILGYVMLGGLLSILSNKMARRAD